jgi:hypothetical protein
MGETDIDECIMILTEIIHEQGEVVFSLSCYWGTMVKH